MNYARKKGRVADIISDEGDYFVVELSNRRRVRWKKDGTIDVIEFGSLNPHNENYFPCGKILETV